MNGTTVSSYSVVMEAQSLMRHYLDLARES